MILNSRSESLIKEVVRKKDFGLALFNILQMSISRLCTGVPGLALGIGRNLDTGCTLLFTSNIRKNSSTKFL